MDFLSTLYNNGVVNIPFFALCFLVSVLIALIFGFFLLQKRLKNKYAEEFKLRLEIERFYEILSMAPDGYFSWFYDHTRNTVREVCSRRLAVLLGLYKGVNSDFANILERICDEDRQNFIEAVNALRSKGEAFAFEFRLPDMERRLIAIGSRSENIAGTVLSDTIWIRDITANADSMDDLFIENTELKKECSFFRKVLDTLPFPIWTRDATLSLNYCNEAYSKVVGSASMKDVLSSNLELAQGESLHKTRSLAAAARSAGKAMNEKEYLVLNGKRRLTDIIEIPFETEESEEKKLSMGLAYPLDKEEELEAKLKGYINAHDGVLENLTTAIVIFDAGTKLSFYNSPFLNLWGIDTDWLDTHPTYSSFLDALREKKALPEVRDFPAFKREELEIFKTLVIPQEDLLYLPQGKTLRRFMLPHPLGGVLISYEDVTDRISMERSFNTLIEVQRATIDNIHEAVVLLDVDERLKLYNSPYMNLWEFDSEFLNQKPSLEELVEKHRRFFTKDDKKWNVLKNELIQFFIESSAQVRITRLDGRILEASSTRLADGGILITFVDITNAAKTEKMMQERSQISTRMNALRTKFISDLANKFKAPLSALCEEDSVPSLKDAIKIRDSFDDLMKLAIAESASNSLNLDAVEMKALLEDIIKEVKERVSRKNIELETEFPDDLGWIIADKNRLKQILLYILTSALNIAGAGSRFSILVHKLKKQDENSMQNKDWITITFNPKFIPEDKGIPALSELLGIGEPLVNSLLAVNNGYIETTEKEGYTLILLHLPADKTCL